MGKLAKELQVANVQPGQNEYGQVLDLIDIDGNEVPLSKFGITRGYLEVKSDGMARAVMERNKEEARFCWGPDEWN